MMRPAPSLELRLMTFRTNWRTDKGGFVRPSERRYLLRMADQQPRSQKLNASSEQNSSEN
jgi:hypothetical protein